ncbi:MAG: PEP-CTERM sorting domain-containing protein [Candidatus Competibacteraceae bacterium]|nr:PEP-CTERM sorting domain-containing protein [Candidatus Competibacteraceae bacterium]
MKSMLMIRALTFATAVVCALSPAVHAQVLTFETGTASDNQFTQNFRRIDSWTDNTVGQTDPTAGEPNNDYAFLSTSTVSPDPINGGLLLFDTTPADTTAGTDNTFAGPLTITLDISAVQADSSIGIMFLDGTNTNNLLALFNLDTTGTSDRIRFFRDGIATAVSAGTQIGTTANGGSGLNISGTDPFTFGTMTVTYTPGTSNDTLLSLTVGTLSHSVSILNTDRIDTPRIGVRLFDPSSAAGSVKFDNFSIVPEPSTVALLLCGLGALAALRRRRTS